MRRRSFLKLAGGGIAGGLLSSLVQTKRSLSQVFVPPEEEWVPGAERWIASVCQQCPAGCGIRVKVVEGRAVKIEGNRLHPINRGGLCPRGQAGLQALYDPDRIRGPMKRAGERGGGRWQSISWEEGIKAFVEELKGLREQGEPHALVAIRRRHRGHRGHLLARFLEAYGSPNDIAYGPRGSEALALAHHFTQGIRDLVAYDWGRANYAVSFGASLLESWGSPVRQIKALAEMRQGRPGRRGKFVQVASRFSISAVKADEWILLRPGTTGALALGMAHVMIKEGLYDQAFIKGHSFGFPDWKALVLREYPPEWAAAVTGVRVETIRRLAREFSMNGPSVAIPGEEACGHTNAVSACMAIHALNALAGSLEVPGGVLVQQEPPFAEWPEVVKDEVAEKGLAMPRIDLLREAPYPIRILLLDDANPRYDWPSFQEAFGRIPFIASFSPFLDESTAHADLALPASTFLERWEDDQGLPSVGVPVVGIRQPVVKPFAGAMETTDLLLQVAREIGGAVADSLPWGSFEELLRARFDGLYMSGEGSIKAESFEGFWQRLIEEGGWWGTAYPFRDWERAFRTPSGRFEFSSQIMREMPGEKGIASGRPAYMPYYVSPNFFGDEGTYPFFLIPYDPITLAEGNGANQPWLLEMYGVHVGRAWEAWIEINPETARRLGIAEGDWASVESAQGRLKVKAKLLPGVMPDAVQIPFGLGHTALGRWASRRGENPAQILAPNPDPVAGHPTWLGTRVRILKV